MSSVEPLDTAMVHSSSAQSPISRRECRSSRLYLFFVCLFVVLFILSIILSFVQSVSRDCLMIGYPVHIIRPFVISRSSEWGAHCVATEAGGIHDVGGTETMLVHRPRLGQDIGGARGKTRTH